MTMTEIIARYDSVFAQVLVRIGKEENVAEAIVELP